MVRLTSMLLGGQAVYWCDQGYYLSGSYVRVCGVLGTWSGGTPSCLGKQSHQCMRWDIVCK